MVGTVADTLAGRPFPSSRDAPSGAERSAERQGLAPQRPGYRRQRLPNTFFMTSVVRAAGLARIAFSSSAMRTNRPLSALRVT